MIQNVAWIGRAFDAKPAPRGVGAAAILYGRRIKPGGFFFLKKREKRTEKERKRKLEEKNMYIFYGRGIKPEKKG